MTMFALYLFNENLYFGTTHDNVVTLRMWDATSCNVSIHYVTRIQAVNFTDKTLRRLCARTAFLKSDPKTIILQSIENNKSINDIVNNLDVGRRIFVTLLECFSLKEAWANRASERKRDYNLSYGRDATQTSESHTNGIVQSIYTQK